MPRITKKDMEIQIKSLEDENKTLKQEILTLNAKLNFYETVQKQAGDAFSVCASWINGFVPKQDAKQ